MSSKTNNTPTKEQLLSALEYDGIVIDTSTITNAKNNNGTALRDIGRKYYVDKENYTKAVAWYRLAANQNNMDAQNIIGVCHHNGEGVPRDYSIAMEYYLKAAVNNSGLAMGNVGTLFHHGLGIIADKYKALEWYHKSQRKSESVKMLHEEGFYLTEEDKNKTIYQLIQETEDIVRTERKKKEKTLKEENETLKQVKQKHIHQIELLNQLITSLEQQLENKDNAIKSLNAITKTLLKNNEA